MRLNTKKLIQQMLAADEGEKHPTDCGVYAIVNQPTSWVYIGSAVNIRNRIGQHKSQLRKGKHSNELLLSDWRKYGEPAFKFGTLYLCHKWDRLIVERMLTAQIIGPGCYSWGVEGQRSQYAGHPGVPGYGVRPDPFTRCSNGAPGGS